jgi:hypothetical protein
MAIEYKRDGKKIIKIVTKEVNEKRMASRIARLKRDVAHADGQIAAWTRTRDATKVQLQSLEKVYNDKPFVFR